MTSIGIGLDAAAGNLFDPSQLSGKIAAVLVRAAASTAADLTNVDAFLKTKYGL